MSIEKEVTILVMKDNGKRYKVTRRIPEMKISDTMVFSTEKEATKQFQEWLSSH